MATLKTVKHHHDFAHQLYGLVDVTQGITVLRMQQVRASVLQSRAYMEGVISVFREVRRSHRKEVEKLIAQKKKLPFLEEKKQGTVCILLTSSGKFSGLLTQKIIREFAEHVKNTDCDVVVVGMTGHELLPQFLRKNIQAKYFDFDLENPSRERLTELLTAVADYENVTVFTGKFQNLISQVPTAYNITGFEALRQENKESENSHEFLFEPSLHEIISFFVTQVTAVRYCVKH